MERILIIDDEPMNLKLTKFILDNAGYEVVTTESGISGIELLQEIPFDLLLLDIEMPEMDGLEVLRRVRNIPEIAKTKVIFLTASNSKSDLSDAARLHAARFIQKPCLPDVLLRTVREAFEETTASLLLIVDDEPMSRALTRNAFESLFRVECVPSGQDALDFLEQAVPDMILMDLYMPGMDGLDTFRKVKKMAHCRHVPIIFMTAAEDNETELELFRAGAVDFIRKPFIAEIARERVKRILELKRLQNFLHEEVDRRTAQYMESARKVQRRLFSRWRGPSTPRTPTQMATPAAWRGIRGKSRGAWARTRRRLRISTTPPCSTTWGKSAFRARLSPRLPA